MAQHPLYNVYETPTSLMFLWLVPLMKSMRGRISCLPLQTGLLHVNLDVSVLSPYSPATH